MRMPYRVIVYEQDGNYFAEDSFGNLLQSMSPNGDDTEPLTNPNTDPAPVLQAALNRQGDIYVADGSYRFNLDFQGLNVRSFSRITAAKDARFILPRGYFRDVFIFDSVQATLLDGGFYTEEGGLGDPNTGEGSAERNWTLLHFIGGPFGSGTFSNVVQNIRAWYVGTIIRFSARIVNEIWGFVNGNQFSNFSVFVYRIGIQFSEIGFFNRNIFENLLFQPQSNLTSETGATQISGLANTFLNVYFIDSVVNINEQVIEQVTGNVAEITSNARSTLIIGGIFTFPSDKFVDEGVDTQIIDELNIQLGRNILS